MDLKGAPGSEELELYSGSKTEISSLTILARLLASLTQFVLFMIVHKCQALAFTECYFFK